MARPNGTSNGTSNGAVSVVASLTPGLQVLRDYDRSWLRPDLLAGVAVAAYLVPQVMAYAEIAGMPPASGLASACVALVVYAVLGSSRQLSAGPESTTALLTATSLGTLAAGAPQRYTELAAGLAVLVGAIVLLARLLRAGVLADLLGKPVLVGYLAGVAIAMIVSQLSKVTGVRVEGEGVPAELRSFGTHLAGFSWVTAVFAALMLAALLLLTRWRPHWPMTLAVVLAATAAVPLLGLEGHGIRLVGDAALRLQAPGVPTLGLDEWLSLLIPAAGIALVGYSDNVLESRAFAARQGQTIDGNSELVALGTANLLVGLVRGFPVSSSGSRTAIGAAQGSRTQLHSLVAVAIVLVIAFFGQGLLARFPSAALGALVIYAAFQLIDLAAFRRIAAFRRGELMIAVTTMAGVVLLGVLYGVLVAVVVSVVELLRRLARPHDAVLGIAPGVAGMHDLDDYPQARPVPGLVVYRYDAPLCFANAEDFRSSALAAAADAPGTRWFLLNAEANVEVDLTAAEALQELIGQIRALGIEFAMARVKQDLRVVLDRAGVMADVGPDRVFMTLPTAVQAFRDWDEQHLPGAPAGST